MQFKFGGAPNRSTPEMAVLKNCEIRGYALRSNDNRNSVAKLWRLTHILLDAVVVSGPPHNSLGAEGNKVCDRDASEKSAYSYGSFLPF
jgi:hypothetical protein